MKFAVPDALKNPDFRIYFFGQLISILGTFTQYTAQAWVIYQITSSALWLGIAAAIGFSPLLFFTLFGGGFADRFNRRKLLIFSQIGQMLLAFVFAGLVLTNNATIYTILPLAFLLGIFSAIDLPAQQAFVTDLVGLDKVTSAVSLNSAMLQVGRMGGPLVAGALIATMGVANAFIFNGITFIAVIISLIVIKSHTQAKASNGNPIEKIKIGLQYVRKNAQILDLVIIAALGPLIGFAVGTLAPALVASVYGRSAGSLGIFMGLSGFGALLAALMLPKLTTKFNPKALVVIGNFAMAACLALMYFSNFITGTMLFFFMSFFFVTTNSTTNVMIQRLAPPEMRGRVMSIWSIASFGMFPIGAFIAGIGAEAIGTLNLLLIESIVFFIVLAILLLTRKGLQEPFKKKIKSEELSRAEEETAKYPEL